MATPKIPGELLMAARSGDTRRLTHGDCLLLCVTPEGNTALHIAAGLGHLEFVVKVLDMESSLLTKKNKMGDTPLHCAARAGHGLIVSEIITRARGIRVGGLAELLRAQNNQGDTALHEAAQNGREPVVALLLGEEDPVLATMLNKANASALYLAVARMSERVVSAMVTAPSSTSSAAGPNKTALHVAACLPTPEILKKIVGWKPELCQQTDASGRIPLHYAVGNSYHLMVNELLKKGDNHNSTVYLRDNDGYSSLHIAARWGHVDIITELINCCPDCDEIVDNGGKNFLHAAVEMGRDEVVEYALKEGAFGKLLNAQDDDGNTPLHLAVQHGDSSIIYSLLLDTRVNSCILNNKGLAPIDIAHSIKPPTQGFEKEKMIAYLEAAGSISWPEWEDMQRTPSSFNKKELNEGHLSMNLSIISVLIVGAAFAAPLTLPGEGQSGLVNRHDFKAFMIADSVAMICATSAAVVLLKTGSEKQVVRIAAIKASMLLTGMALMGMVIAFLMSGHRVFSTNSSTRKGIPVLVALIIYFSPLLVFGDDIIRFMNVVVKTRIIACRRERVHYHVIRLAFSRTFSNWAIPWLAMFYSVIILNLVLMT